jgi:hypothetical protein
MPSGRFAFAWVAFDGEPSTIVRVAPFVLDAFVVAGVAAGFALWPSDAPRWVLATAAALPAVNSTVGVLGRYRRVNDTDLSNVDWKVATPFLFLVLAYWAALGAAVLLLLT